MLCILQLYIQFVSCELFLQLYYIFPCLLGFCGGLPAEMLFGGSKDKVRCSGPSKVRFLDLGKLPAEYKTKPAGDGHHRCYSVGNSCLDSVEKKNEMNIEDCIENDLYFLIS